MCVEEGSDLGRVRKGERERGNRVFGDLETNSQKFAERVARNHLVAMGRNTTDTSIVDYKLQQT